jgi:hypothetical protein
VSGRSRAQPIRTCPSAAAGGRLRLGGAGMPRSRLQGVDGVGRNETSQTPPPSCLGATAGGLSYLGSVMASKPIVSNGLTVNVITRLQLVSMSPTNAYNCHNITLYGSGLAGVNLVWFGSAYQKPWTVTSTEIQVEVSEFAENGAEVVAEDPSGLHSNPLVITILPGGC